MFGELRLAMHFIAEVLARRYEYARVAEPDLVMDNPLSVAEYRDAGLVTGNGSSVYLFNLLLLCAAVRSGAVVVDLACGPANLLVELARLNPQAQFVGVDLSPEMLRCAEELRASTGVGNVRFVEADITALNAFADQSVDIVMSTLSLHHLPQRALLDACAREIARVVRPQGAIHLMDFASMKRAATAEYFVLERTRDLGKFLAQDYRNSLHAAYRVEDFQALLPVLRAAGPAVDLRRTFGVPFMVALTSLQSAPLGDAHRLALGSYWARMLPRQRADFDAMRFFFQLGGLRVVHPSALGAT